MTVPPIYTGDPARDVARIAEIVAMPGVCSLDFETTIDTAIRREVCTIQVTHQNGAEAFAYVWPHGRTLVPRALGGAKARFVAHNAIFETECLVNNGVFSPPVDCTLIAGKVLFGVMEGDKSKRTLWSLKACAARFLGKERDKTIRDRDWREPPDAEAIEYGMEDTRDALALWLDHFVPALAKDQQSWAGYTLKRDALSAVAECNLHGLPFDPKAHDVLIASLSEEELNGRTALHFLSADEIENHGSPKQVGEWFIGVLMPADEGWTAEQRKPWRFSIAYQEATGQHWPTTKTGALALGKNIVESRLKTLTALNPELAAYMQARAIWGKSAKLIQAFGATLRKFIDPAEPHPYLRGSLVPHGAQTGRFSARDPNIQQMPTEERFRALFKAAPGRKLVICDYGQIELRIGCLIADDKAMQAVYAEGADIHQATATSIKRILTGDPTAEATPKERKDAKAPNFAGLYGAMANTIAINAGLPLAEAEKLLDAFLKTYPGIDNYRKTAFAAAQKIGGVRLVSGQFLRLAPDTRPAQVINAPVQGSAADVLYKASKLVHDDVVSLRVLDGRDVWMGGLVHDEIILDCAEEDAEAAAGMLSERMVEALLSYYPEAAGLGMATLAAASIVDSWAEKG